MENENKVVEEVLDEIKRIGGESKENYDALRKEYEELKATVDENSDDVLAEEKLDKLSQAISTRQDELDKKAHERIDNIEVAINRIPKGSDSKEEHKEARDFQIACATVQARKDLGVTFEDVEKLEADPKAYSEYKKVFEKYLRRYGGNRDMSLSPDDQKALSVGVDPDGGITVTPAMSSKIITKIYESDPIRSLASVESITTNALEFRVDFDQAGYGWEDETNAGTETTTPQFEKKRIPVHIMYAKPKATQQLLEDSGINIENYLANKVAERFGRVEGAAFVNGTGIGQPRGFLTYDNGTNYGQIEQTNMGAAAALTADGFIDVKYSLTEYYLNRCSWLMNRLTVAAAMKLKDGEGNYIWKPGLTGDATATLLGLPVRMSTTMPQVAADALAVVIADFGEAYMIVDRLGITIQRDPYTAKPFVEFYTRKRVGGDVVNYDAIKIGKISA